MCHAAFLIPLLLTAPLRAQVVGDCAHGRAEADLAINDVRARVFNTGSLFYGNTTFGDGYLVPRGCTYVDTFGDTRPCSPIYAASLWVGGLVNDTLRVAGAAFDDFEFWPGPLDEQGQPPEDCAPYDRIFRVSRGDVERYYWTGQALADLRDWPYHLGAPVLDGDGVEGNYNLAGGDQPAISGEQTAWWVMNDAGNMHASTRTPPIRLEARVEAFAAANAAWPGRLATLYRYQLTHRGEAPLDSAYFGVFSDSDLGDVADDYVGSDTTLDLGFTYNGDNDDAIYGVPPAVGYKVLRGPVGLPNGRDDDRDGETDEAGERLGMTAFSYFTLNFAPDPPPSGGGVMYRRLRGVWEDGTPMTAAGRGYQTAGPVTRFAFPGDPVANSWWSERCPNHPSCGTPLSPGDRRHLLSMGPFRLEPGETAEVVFAVVFAQGADRLDSVTELRRAARYVQNAYDAGLYTPTRVEGGPEPPEVPDEVLLSRPFPNPFTGEATVRFSVPEASPVRLALYDALGREVAVAFEGTAEPGEHAVTVGGGLSPGLYLVRFDAPGARRAFPLLKLR